jgi:uncharacterized membrane protein YoaK (UPF0700 family)
MFYAEPHSFSQQARLAITLAWIAGYTNTVTIIACGLVTSHLSGTTSNLGRDVAEGKWDLAALALSILLAFFSGAVISGVCTELGRRRGWDSIYVLPMFLQIIVLAVFAVGLQWATPHPHHADYYSNVLGALAAAAMGIQNATITRISNGVVRTTHVTGVVTDFALELVQFLLWVWDRKRDRSVASVREMARSLRKQQSTKRLGLLAAIFSSFAFGAAMGAAIYESFTGLAMFLPFALLTWIMYMDISHPIAELEASSLVDADSGLGLPEGLSIFHIRKVSKRTGKVHRLPNLLGWCSRLPASTKVVIMDLGDRARLDHDAAGDLHELMLIMRNKGKRLLVAGLGPEEQKRLRREWGEDFRPGDLSPDLEMAIAYGMILVDQLGDSPSGAR